MGRKVSTGVAGAATAGSFPNVVTSTSTTAQSNKIYWVDTASSAVTLTLPATPNRGDIVQVFDVRGTFSTNNLTINPGVSGRIMRQTQGDTMTVSVDGAAFKLYYYDATYGWLLEQV